MILLGFFSDIDLVVSVKPQIGETKSFVWERFLFLPVGSTSVNDL